MQVVQIDAVDAEPAQARLASLRNVFRSPVDGRRAMHGAAYERSAPDAADYLVAIDFDDLSGLQTYLRHPAHEELGARFGESLSSAFVYDFEVGGIAELSRLA